MPLKLDLGSGAEVALITEGDLAKYLRAGLDSIINFKGLPAGLLGAPVAQAPLTAFGTGFKFSYAPSWTVPQQVGITLSVVPEATCKLTLIKPGDALFSYVSGDDGSETPVKAAAERHYIGLELECTIALDGGAQWSSGHLGISGNASRNDTFRVANYVRVDGSTTVREAIRSAFSRFVLPFRAESVEALPDGHYLDFDFLGKLALGFGATYGFSGLFLAGRSNGEVRQSFSSAVGKAVVSAAPSFRAGAAFKLQYTHEDAFRVVAGRVKNETTNGATLYLLRRDASKFSTSETFGITLNAGVKFAADPAVIKSEVQEGAQRLLRGTAGVSLGTRLAGVADSAAGAINDSVNGLLARGDGHKIALELIQSRAAENTALFIYNFDFNHGTDAYECAMCGDYAKAITMPGVDLDPQSFIERLYTTRSGLNLQFFNVAGFQDITDYIQKTQITYAGERTFQIRDTVGVKAVSGLFGKERQADLYFIAQCRSALGSTDRSGFGVRVNAIFIDRNNKEAFSQTERLLGALGIEDAARAVGAYVAHRPDGSVQLTLDMDAALLAALKSTDYMPNGKPAKEPHTDDKRNYEEFVWAVRAVIGPQDAVARMFEESFATYNDWLQFNRAVTDQPGSTKPGDRLSEGNANGENWPTGYPPRGKSDRLKVQTYILAGQHFMNFCDGLKRLASALPDVDTEEEYEALLRSIKGMIQDDTPFPTYFFKPGLVAVSRLAEVTLIADGDVPDPNAAGMFALSLKPKPAAAVAGG